MKRLFAAINLSQEIKKKLNEAIAVLQWPKKGITYTKPENLHLTVEFFGQAEEEKIGRILKERFKNIPVFKCLINKISLFPWRAKPRYLVAEATCPFIDRPHITLIRIKRHLDSSFLKQAEKIHWSPQEIEVRSIDLMASDLYSDGPRYSLIKKINLK